ncbi:MAG: hypothetical protein R2771_03290 [Saprospiraceae bacterium]
MEMPFLSLEQGMMYTTNVDGANKGKCTGWVVAVKLLQRNWDKSDTVMDVILLYIELVICGLTS